MKTMSSKTLVLNLRKGNFFDDVCINSCTECSFMIALNDDAWAGQGTEPNQNLVWPQYELLKRQLPT